MHKPKTRIFFLILFIITLGFTTSSISVNAAPSRDEVFENAPDGLNLSGMIENPDYKKGTNDAQLITDFPVNIIELISKTGSNDQIGSFWGKKYKDDGNTQLYNYFDLTKEQTISAWIYMGDVYHYYPEYAAGQKESTYSGTMDSNKTPDGLALVLQNDDNGAQAISTAIGGDNTGAPSTGETLGVWGGSSVNHSPLTATNTGISAVIPPSEDLFTNLSDGAIQNSFAVEFDALQNFNKPKPVVKDFIYQKLDGKDDYFDIENDYKGQHISVGYPGDNTGYTHYSTDTYTAAALSTSRAYYFSQKYRGGTSNNIYVSGYMSDAPADMNVDKAWRHLTFSYKPTGSNSASFKYSFNDKERDGTAKTVNQRNSGSGTIDLSKLKSTSNIRWGFTASTGSQYSAPNTIAVVMQQMPSTANVQSSTSLADMSQYNDDGTLGREIKDLYQNDSFKIDNANPISGFLNNVNYNVANNDTLRFKYDLTYTSGTLDTGKIKTVVKLPDYVNFVGGLSDTLDDQNIGEVIYSGDGSSSDKSYQISANDITKDTDGKNILNLELETMDNPNQKATIYLYGQAIATTTPQLVDGEPTSYRSTNYISDATSPAFIINDQLQIDTTEKDKTVSIDEDAQIGGTINYVNNSTFNGKDAVLHTEVNGTKLDNTSIETKSGSVTTDYTMIATNALSSGSPLKVGENTVKVYVTDSLNRVSNTLTYTITVKDYKDLLLESTSADPMTVKITDPFQLDSQANYSNGDIINKISQVTGHIKIDDGEYTETSFSGGSFFGPKASLYLNMSAGKLSVGQHTIKLYIDDGTRNSNVVEYHINVISRTLVLTANNDKLEQTVHDNSNVSLNGTYAYDDESDFTNKVTKITYQITNEDGTIQDAVSKDISSDKDNSSDFSINLKPIGADLFTNDTTQTVSDYLKSATGLKIGRNEIKVTAYDGDEATSNTITFIVNVPDIAPTISTSKQQITTISHMKINLPMTFTYPDDTDSKYLLQNSDLATFVTIKDSSDDPVMSVIDKPKVADGKIETPYQLNPQTQWMNNLSSGENNISVYIMDRYLRQTNTLDYQLNVLPSGTQITVGDYRFETIDPKDGIDDYIKRDGNWEIKIDSYKDKWDLRAKADNMLHQDNNGDYSEASALELVDFNKENETPISLTLNPLIASGDSTDSQSPVSYTLFGQDSSLDKGILLKTNGIPVYGEYRSTIEWSIDDSV